MTFPWWFWVLFVCVFMPLYIWWLTKIEDKSFSTEKSERRNNKAFWWLVFLFLSIGCWIVYMSIAIGYQ